MARTSTSSAKSAPKASAAKAPKASPASAPAPAMVEVAATDLAAAGTTASGAPKNFRNHPDIENFYRFIYENDLREEGLEILNDMHRIKLEKRAAKKAQADA